VRDESDGERVASGDGCHKMAGTHMSENVAITI
jgi:hypothetical protein